MTRLSSTHLKAFLLIATSSLYSGVTSATPAIWEAQLGATVTSAAANPALDGIDDGTTGADLTFGSMSFPFAGTTYTGANILNISSNGFISLGGDNGADTVADPALLTGDPHARIAPFWTDLDPGEEGGDVYINRFNDDADPAIDRIVITFVTGYNDCTNEECSVLAQVQLLEDGTVIFGYNGIDLENEFDTADDDVLIGLSPAGGVATPASTDISDKFPSFDTATEPTVYELFVAASAPPFDLDDSNVIFTPNATGGYIVTDSMLTPPESSEPPTWENALGTTIDGQALDNTDDATVNLEFDTMEFPFAGTTYTGLDILNISSNGFISLGGDNDHDCCSGDPAILTSDPFPRIAPFWTDLDPGAEGGDVFINRFDDDADPAIDRIVITFAVGHHSCDADECSVLAQVQLLENGTIIFGYNGVDLINALDNVTEDVLVGISPANGASNPGSSDISNTAPFNTVNEPTVYELFIAASAPPFDLDGGNVKFTPNGAGGYQVEAPGVSGSAPGGGGGGGGGGRNSNKHHCSLGGSDAAFDPTLWLLVLVSIIYLGQRRHRTLR